MLAALMRRLVGHLDRGLGCGRAVTGEEHLAERWWRDAQQLLGETDARLVGQAEKGRVVELAQLGLDGPVDRGLAVTMHGDPQRRNAVEIPIANGVVEVHALGAVDDERIVAGPDRMLRKGMPHRAKIA